MPRPRSPRRNNSLSPARLADLINASWDLAETQRTGLDAKLDDHQRGTTGWLEYHGSAACDRGNGNYPCRIRACRFHPGVRRFDGDHGSVRYQVHRADRRTGDASRLRASLTSRMNRSHHTAAEDRATGGACQPAGQVCRWRCRARSRRRPRPYHCRGDGAAEDAGSVCLSPLPASLGASAAAVADIQQKAHRKSRIPQGGRAVRREPAIRWSTRPSNSGRLPCPRRLIAQGAGPGLDVASGLSNVGYDAEQAHFRLYLPSGNSRDCRGRTGREDKVNSTSATSRRREESGGYMGMIENRPKALLAEIQNIASNGDIALQTTCANACLRFG